MDRSTMSRARIKICGWFFANQWRQRRIGAERQGFLRKAGKVLPGEQEKLKSKTSRWWRKESFAAEAASHLFLLQQGATKQQGNKEQQSIKATRSNKEQHINKEQLAVKVRVEQQKVKAASHLV